MSGLTITMPSTSDEEGSTVQGVPLLSEAVVDVTDLEGDGHNDATVGITRFAKWRNQMDDNKEYYKTAMGMLELANSPLNGNVGMQATIEDPIWAFLAGPGRDFAKLVLSFNLGVKVGKGGLREASKAKLLEVGLELKVLRMENNGLGGNMGHWGVIVDDESEVIDRGIREAVRRGLVTEAKRYLWWGLKKRANGDIYNRDSIYGERRVVYRTFVGGMAVPLEERLFH